MDNMRSLPIMVAGRTVAVANISRQSANPLITILSINSTSIDLNGAMISCSTRDSSAATTVIHIIGGEPSS